MHSLLNPLQYYLALIDYGHDVTLIYLSASGFIHKSDITNVLCYNL